MNNTIIYEATKKLNSEWIGENAISHEFADGKGKIVISHHVINDDAFAGCKNLTSIVIPNTSINIPDSVTEIEDNAFVNCTKLSKETLDKIRKLNEKAI